MREFPKKGYYMSKTEGQGVIYCSGTKVDNYRFSSAHNEWVSIVWTGVPTLENAEKNYIYSETNPTRFDLPAT